ncbi:hypothetical protein A4A49_05306 [Nicotiana attenuata]|uniref:Uncharacterized protein n=1 Tax=Nicotiana attenuata TaxID=49451 RepID=A0A314LFA2_NICAT|nr:hypothetical protein A4A49_05306 [Nicotiana attenuata]
MAIVYVQKAGLLTRDQQKNLDAWQDRELLKKPVVIDAAKRATDAAGDRTAGEPTNESALALLGPDKDGEEPVAATVTLKATDDRPNFQIDKPTVAPVDKPTAIDQAEKPTAVDQAESTAQIEKVKDDTAAGDITTMGQDNVGVGALECAPSSGAKVVNVEAAPGCLTSTGALTTKVDRATPNVGLSMAKGVGQAKKSATNSSNTDTNSNDWIVVNRTPSKKQSPGLQNQILLSKTIGVSNSFDALVNEPEHDVKEAGNTMQQIGDESRLITGRTNSSGSRVQQQTSNEIGARLHGSTEIVFVGAQLEIGTVDDHIGEDQQGATSAIVVNRKTWSDQVEEEEEDYTDSIQDDSDNKAAQFSATPASKDEAAKVQNEHVSNSTDSVTRRRGLSPNSPIFLPLGQQQIVAATSKHDPNMKDLSIGNMASTSSPIARYNLTPKNILHALVTHDMDTLNSLDKKAVATISKSTG